MCFKTLMHVELSTSALTMEVIATLEQLGSDFAIFESGLRDVARA